MNKERKTSLERYAAQLTNKLGAPVPEKHASNPTTYKTFLRNELESTMKTLERAKQS